MSEQMILTIETILKTANSYVTLAASDAIVKCTIGPIDRAITPLYKKCLLSRSFFNGDEPGWATGRTKSDTGRMGSGSTTRRRVACPFMKSECGNCRRITHTESVCRSEHCHTMTTNILDVGDDRPLLNLWSLIHTYKKRARSRTHARTPRTTARSHARTHAHAHAHTRTQSA